MLDSTSTDRIERVIYPMTPELRERWQRAIREFKVECPEYDKYCRRFEAAMTTPTLSGRVRRAVRDTRLRHAHLAERINVDRGKLTRFLTGRGTLDSDVLDRLIEFVGWAAVAAADAPADKSGLPKPDVALDRRSAVETN